MENRIQNRSTGGGAVAWGVILVVAGIFFLLAQFVPFQLGEGAWPMLVVLAGLALLAIGAAVRPVSGFLVPGSIVTAAGLVLAIQNAFGLWATWSYAWALVAPGAVGVGVMLMGILAHDRKVIDGGAVTALTGLVLFVVFGTFFEAVLHVSGFSLGWAAGVAFPLLLVAVGVVLLAFQLLGRRAATTR